MLIEYLFEEFPNWEEIGDQAVGDLQVNSFSVPPRRVNVHVVSACSLRLHFLMLTSLVQHSRF